MSNSSIFEQARGEQIKAAIQQGLEVRGQLTPRSRILIGLAGWGAFLGIWYGLAKSGVANPQLLPTPVDVFEALRRLFAVKNFLFDVYQSTFRILFSYVLAIGVALPIGILMGTFPAVAAFLNPLVSPFRYLPAPSFIPLLLMWLGVGESQKIALLFLGVIWFLISLIMDNTESVRMELIETARTLGATRWQILKTVILRAALPEHVNTIRQMLAASWTYLVIAEIVATTDGIGAMMMRARRFIQVDEIMAGILMIGILGWLFDAALRFFHARMFAYLYRH
jgi:NitT/TauT family transport system permease protein